MNENTVSLALAIHDRAISCATKAVKDKIYTRFACVGTTDVMLQASFES